MLFVPGFKSCLDLLNNMEQGRPEWLIDLDIILGINDLKIYHMGGQNIFQDILFAEEDQACNIGDKPCIPCLNKSQGLYKVFIGQFEKAPVTLKGGNKIPQTIDLYRIECIHGELFQWLRGKIQKTQVNTT